MRSRLKNTKERQARNNLILSIGGMFCLLALFLIFGIPLIVKLSLFVEKRMDTKNLTKSATDDYVPPPQLDVAFTATNSAEISVSGTGQSEQKIYLFVNDEMVADMDVDSDNGFVFDNVDLKEGDNTIFARAKIEKNTSDDSNVLHIRYLKNPPSLSIDSPSDGQSFGGDRMITVTGKTDESAKVTINGFWAVMQPDGAFRHRLSLQQDGENTIKILSQDEAGNKTEKEVNVTFSP